MHRLAVVSLAIVAACGPSGNPLSIEYVFSNGPSYKCPSTCDLIAMNCDAVLMVRVVDPDDPTQAYVNECERFSSNAENICAIDEVPVVNDAVIPTSRVEVQLAVYAKHELDEFTNGECPTQLVFAADGFPIFDATNPQAPVPALAGRGFVDGHDDTVVVELGCMGLSKIDDDPTCVAQNQVSFDVGVDDFDTQTSVDPTTANQLTVRVGEPRLETHPETRRLEWVFDRSRSAILPRMGNSWSDKIEFEFEEYACVEVQETTIASLRCERQTGSPPELAMIGEFVSGDTITDILVAMGELQVPARGLLLGIVIQGDVTPVGGVSLHPTIGGKPAGTIQYLSADRSTTMDLTETSSAGIFLSDDVPFDADWSDIRGTPNGVSGDPIGGIVYGRITVMVVALNSPS